MVIHNYSRAIEFCQKILDATPPLERKAQTHHMLGGIYGEQKHYKNAIIQFEQSLRAVPDQEKVYFDLGLTYFHLREFIQAEQNFVQCLKLNPNFIQVYYYWGLIFIERNQPDIALDYLSKVEQSQKEFPELYFHKARAFTLLARLDDALKAYQEALPYYLGSPIVYLNMANVYLLMDQPEKALPLLDKAKALAPQLPQIVQSVQIATQALAK